MAEKYIRITSFSGRKWSSGSPVTLEKWVLLHDSEKSANLLQIQFRNIQLRNIKLLNLVVRCYNEQDGSYDTVECSFTGFNAEVNSPFGSNVPIYLNSVFAREFTFIVRNVLYIDGSVWNNSTEMQDIPPAREPTQLGELESQFLKDVKGMYPYVKVTAIPERKDGYWYCACGTFHSDEYTICNVCNSDIEDLLVVADVEHLQTRVAEAIAEKIEEDEKRKQKNKQRNRKIGVAVMVALVLLAAFGYYNSIKDEMAAYANANDLMGAGSYMEAAEEFIKIGNYRNSDEMAQECTYLQGKMELDAKEYDKAKETLAELGDYKDSIELIKEADYSIANTIFEAGQYKVAKEVFLALGEYKDSEEKGKECERLIGEATSAAAAKAEAEAKAKAEADAAAAAKAKAEAEAEAADKKATFDTWNGKWNAYQRSGNESVFVGVWTIDMNSRTVTIDGKAHGISSVSQSQISFSSYTLRLSKAGVANGSGYTIRR